ncbi:Hypothetical predicted protein [Mytilus galloprovincialis]|uniref:BTB domain-containing protein n=1 Tax=Mytilus galloprovincialis TaxID=29158 RepID=A0A8B6BUK3_MYTGA|nr:Hypothetical predicted protein [Mytilus galloprovincialis]
MDNLLLSEPAEDQTGSCESGTSNSQSEYGAQGGKQRSRTRTRSRNMNYSRDERSRSRSPYHRRSYNHRDRSKSPKQTEEAKIPAVLELNVGGQIFHTTLETITKYPESFLGAMFSGRHKVNLDNKGRYFIDRNGDHFEHILEFLRDDTYLPPKGVVVEVFRDADYFAIATLRDKLLQLPPLYPFYGNRPDPIENYIEIKDGVLEAAYDFQKATAHGQTVVHLIYLNEQQPEGGIDFVFYNERHHMLDFAVPFDGGDNTQMIDAYNKDSEDFPMTIPLKVSNKHQALSISNCIMHDLTKQGLDIKLENEDCTTEGSETVFGFTTKKYGEMECKPCYCHSKFTFSWSK